MSESSSSFRDFAARLLDYEGVLVERIEPEGLELLAPAPVAQVLQIPELARLGFAAELPASAERVGLESDWLERFGHLLGERGHTARVVLPVALPQLTNPERVVEHTVNLQNAVYRVGGVTPAWTRYLVMLFRVTAFSDEKRDGVIKLGFNLANGSALDAVVDGLLSAAMEMAGVKDAPVPAPSSLPPLWTPAQLKSRVARALPERIEAHLAPFLKGMQRRLDRDLQRVHDYFDDLRAEALLRLQKHLTAEKESARDRLRLEAIAREYEAKVADLQQKYALRVDVAWSQTLEVVMPVQRVELLIRRRKGERRITLDWNPLARKLDIPPCEYSYTQFPVRVVCDDRLHLISPKSLSPCASCDKAYCRACHPLQCPKCHRKEGSTTAIKFGED
ncbi:MAG: hypothetical protein H0T45_19570 [Pyrinomonadaceae bacterium]|nr:hypothetical protein [Pyrinomonadaceae bacterium]